MKITTLLATSLALSASILSISQATESVAAPSVVVRYADLDVSHTAGSEQLYRRISTAAKVVCRTLDPHDSVAKLELDELYKKCLHEATTQAVESIGRPVFTEFVKNKMTRRNEGMTLAAR